MDTIAILYQNAEICIINKRAGLAVQGGEGVAHSVDVELANQLGQKVYLVHRLDKETAGILVVAKSPQAASKWTKIISTGGVSKEYIALCIGKVKDSKGVIQGELMQRGESRTAVTYYNVEKVFEIPYGEAGEKIYLSKIRLKLGTGRMHQIRIQLAQIGCPIAGDDKHGDFKANKLVKKLCGIKRLQLASVYLKINVPGLKDTFKIDLPEHMETALNSLSEL
ncbi:MAG: RNA pseudouridine synthase [Treponema sp.]|nr:RNA pseudouridine synthase [Treponema sp.]